MTEYTYDPDLPYVVVSPTTGDVRARFKHWGNACGFADARGWKVIDTTPKPRVPDDANYITWWSQPHLQDYMARRVSYDRWKIPEVYDGPIEDLPGVTPETTFTVLEERKS